MLEAVLAAVLAFIVWIILNGGISMAVAHRHSTETFRDPHRFSVNTLLIAVTLYAIVPGFLTISN
jgi:hypothetical protein